VAAGTEHVAVVGGGIGGLASALLLARSGRIVTVLEHDVVSPSADADEAFFAERRGAPQVHQTHAFLARTVVTLRDRLPDILDALGDAGATTMPANRRLGEPQPGDEDLVLLVARRTTYEWVLRSAVLAEPGTDVRMGVTVKGLVAADTNGDGGPPRVVGLTLDDGTTLPADAVVVATGRRGNLPGWLAPLGVELTEEVHPSDLMYLSRWYRRPAGSEPIVELRGVDSRFLKYLAVPGDADSLSITLAIDPDDAELRRALSDDDRFDVACRNLPGPDQFFAEDLVPITPVRPMGGLINRLRTFTHDGAPMVLGLHAVGDAHTCTNPIYGRGCSLALAQAALLADAFVAHPGDAAARATMFESESTGDLEPWFRMSVDWDEAGRAANATREAGDRTPNPVEALFIAAENEPVLARGLTRMFHLLTTPAELFAEVGFSTKAMEVMADPSAYSLPERVGPSRSELLALLIAEPERTSA
jgi:2-polyprenyl-6-methoxyphenol hydroxylase-like FAD-dependent oxidoreductase